LFDDYSNPSVELYFECTILQLVGISITKIFGVFFSSNPKYHDPYAQITNLATTPSFYFFTILNGKFEICRYGNKILWTNCFVVSNVDQWSSLKVRSQLELMHLFVPSLDGGRQG
jgi:hypothetical protein